MRKNKITGKFLAFLFFFFSQHANAQILDTICESFHSKPKFFFQLDAYNSFVGKEPANTFGYKAGLEFNKRVKIGIGYYTLTSDIVQSKTIRTDQNKDTVQNARLDMNFIPVSFEYTFYSKDPWQFTVPINLGAGKSYFWYYKNASGDKGEIDKKTIILTTISVDAQYKIIKYIGVGAGLGYRVMLKDNSNINENFNSVIYSLQLRIFVDEIVKTIFHKGK